VNFLPIELGMADFLTPRNASEISFLLTEFFIQRPPKTLTSFLSQFF
jgi:hypothetical protein